MHGDASNYLSLCNCVYMPFESTDANCDEYCCYVLAQVMHIVEQFPNAHVILEGDFNVDLTRSTVHSMCTHVENFCSTYYL